MNLSFSLNGRKVSSDALAALLEERILEAAIAELSADLRAKLAPVQCPEHDETPAVVVSGNSLEALTFSVQGCCQSLIDAASELLAEEDQREPGRARSMNPKVFISHASEDKDRFVLDFARRLRARGIDAWVDRWEMLPGDSIVDKLFEEGLKQAEAVIVVLSPNSVDKPWVREELNAAFVKRVNDKTKLIPVVLEGCTVPEALRSILWEPIPDLAAYDEAFERIVMAIYGTAEKPPLGQRPTYVETKLDTVRGLTPIDSMVLKAACEVALEQGHPLVNLEQFDIKLQHLGPSHDAVVEALEVLNNRSYISLGRVMNGISHFKITVSGFEAYARTYVPDYPAIVDRVSAAIVNEQLRDLGQLAQAVGQPAMLVEHILDVVAQRGLIKVAKHYGGGHVTVVNPELRRILRTG